MNLLRLVVILLMPALSLTGCATIVGKNVYPLTINSHPDGANILVTDERGKKMFSGTTPTTVTLPAGESYFHAKKYTVVFSKDGYSERVVKVKASISGWYIGNILFGGLIGMLIVDPISGKMWKLQSDVSENLAAKVASGSSDQSLQIVTLDQVSDDVKKRMVAIN